MLVCGGIDVQAATTRGVLNWLRREARHVFLQHADGGDGVTKGPTKGLPIYAIEHATLAEALAYFQGLKLIGAKAEIADKIVREIASETRTSAPFAPVTSGRCCFRSPVTTTERPL